MVVVEIEVAKRKLVDQSAGNPKLFAASSYASALGTCLAPAQSNIQTQDYTGADFVSQALGGK